VEEKVEDIKEAKKQREVNVKVEVEVEVKVEVKAEAEDKKYINIMTTIHNNKLYFCVYFVIPFATLF
jgi:hypothetical protein